MPTSHEMSSGNWVILITALNHQAAAGVLRSRGSKESHPLGSLLVEAPAPRQGGDPSPGVTNNTIGQNNSGFCFHRLKVFNTPDLPFWCQTVISNLQPAYPHSSPETVYSPYTLNIFPVSHYS